jgi:hypothetical protein
VENGLNTLVMTRKPFPPLKPKPLNLMSQSTEKLLEEVWEHREEVIYPDLFGAKSNGIFVVKTEMFQKAFQQSSIDPR